MNSSEHDAITRPMLTPEELKELSQRTPWRAVLGIARVYGLLVLAIGVALTFGGWWMIPAFAIVAALQHAISILQHEAVHGLLFRSHRLNEWVGKYLLSYPIGFSLEYRTVHFAHHRHLGEEGDPDLHNYKPFPATSREVWAKIIRECSGWGAVMQFFGTGRSTSGARSHVFQVAATQCVILALFTAAGHSFDYFFLWFLPLVTLAKGFAQLRNLAEHFIRADAPRGTERLRTFRSSLVERFFLAPLNFHYHAEHHWYTTVPYYNLPALRRVLQTREGYQTNAEWTPGYVWVLRRLTRQTSV